MRFQGKTWKEIENTCSSIIKYHQKYTSEQSYMSLIIMRTKLYSQHSQQCEYSRLQLQSWVKVTYNKEIWLLSVPGGSSGFRFLHCFKSCFYCHRLCTPWQSRSHAVRVASFASSAYLWQGAKCCNPPMTNNVTARFCLRGCSHKGGDGGEAANTEAVIERRGKCERGGQSSLRF